MKIKILSYILLLAVVISGCKIIDPVEKVPTYIQIDSFYVETTDPIKTGSTYSKIGLVWVYFDGEAVGVFDIPATIPVLAGRPGRIIVSPGVLNGGLSNQQLAYPFYLGDTFSISPAPGEIIKHTGKTIYVPDARFLWKEDFENGNTFLKYNIDNGGDTTIVRIADDSRVIEGKGSGLITLSTSNTQTSESITSQSFAFGTVNDAFLEIDYKCSVPFEVGLEGIYPNGTTSKYIAGMLPKSDRNKFYVNLRTAIGEMQARYYRVIIRAKLNEGQSDGYVVIDNIKVIAL
jgi:hypothetical protein